MRRTCCHTFLASILKFLNFLHFFVGLCMIIYSAYMLNHWHRRPVSDVIDANVQSLPDPWFIYSFMGVGILLCCITLAGQIAAEAFSGCCLCFYAVLATLFILLEASLVMFIAFDREWEKDLPPEPTGELDSLRIFVEENMDFCKWVAVGVFTLQALSLVLAMILRALVSSESVEVFSEENYYRSRLREPLLSMQSGQTFKGDSHVSHDIWSSRMREKYGLNIKETNNY